MLTYRRVRRLATGLLLGAGLSVGMIGVGSAAAAAPVPVAKAPAKTYTVQYGDSLGKVARNARTSLSALLQANRMTASSTIWPGRTLRLPDAAVIPVVRYEIQRNDSLVKIAGATRVRVGDLMALNRLKPTSLLVVGRLLLVPPGGVVPPGQRSVTVVPGAVVAPPVPAKPPVVPSPPSKPGGKPPTKPGGKPPAKGPAAQPPVPYVVQPGDSFVRIAQTTGVSKPVILAMNHLTLASTLRPGQTLLLPPGTQIPGPAAPPTPPTDPPTPPADPRTVKVQKVLDYVRAQLGKPYRFDAAGPDAFDCSGLVMMAYQQVGVTLPHYSVRQATMGTEVDWQQNGIQPGDLIFSKSSHETRPIGHVEIAVDPTSSIHAPRTGDVVKYRKIPVDKIVVVRRFL